MDTGTDSEGRKGSQRESPHESWHHRRHLLPPPRLDTCTSYYLHPLSS